MFAKRFFPALRSAVFDERDDVFNIPAVRYSQCFQHKMHFAKCQIFQNLCLRAICGNVYKSAAEKDSVNNSWEGSRRICWQWKVCKLDEFLNHSFWILGHGWVAFHGRHRAWALFIHSRAFTETAFISVELSIDEFRKTGENPRR
jgi:hypothetical protein